MPIIKSLDGAHISFSMVTRGDEKKLWTRDDELMLAMTITSKASIGMELELYINADDVVYLRADIGGVMRDVIAFSSINLYGTETHTSGRIQHPVYTSGRIQHPVYKSVWIESWVYDGPVQDKSRLALALKVHSAGGDDRRYNPSIYISMDDVPVLLRMLESAAGVIRKYKGRAADDKVATAELEEWYVLAAL